MAERMANALAVFNKDGSLNDTGRSVLDAVGEVSGKKSTVHYLPEEDRGKGIGGYVMADDPEKIYLDPEVGNAHVLAHEAMHSQLRTDLYDDQVQNLMKSTPEKANFFSSEDMKPEEVPREGGNRLRYFHEKTSVPIMLEEAAAQGGARGVLDKLGLKGGDRGFRIRGSEGVLGDDKIYRNKDGSVDELAYPLIYRDGGVDEYTKQYGGEFEGKPLGIGIDPRFNDAEREVYYDIADNSRARVQREFDRYRSKFK